LNTAAITTIIYILIKPAAVDGLVWLTNNELLAVGLLMRVPVNSSALSLFATFARIDSLLLYISAAATSCVRRPKRSSMDLP
jgi:hypothetical protein